MHYIIIIVIIAVIVIYQLKIYSDTKEKLDDFRDIFSDKKDACQLSKDALKDALVENIEKLSIADLDKMLSVAGYDVEKYHFTKKNAEGEEMPIFKRKKAKSDLIKGLDTEITGISSKHDNLIFQEIITSINNYLSVNKSSVSDFHLMKDIVDRNCDAKEEEINTQIPIPLYLGLVGTMVGILVGVGYLWISGGLNDLLSAGSGNSGADGVEALLGGVALAMVASILGILLTTFGSMKAKTAKVKLEHNKHIFLSWIQAKLLPNLNNDMAQTLEEMSQKLEAFNNTFSSNTSELGKTLSQVNESYRLQSQLLEIVKQIADKDVSVKNLELYNALKNSTHEIGLLGKYLQHSNEYLANVRALNEKLDASERRMTMLEEMGGFFKSEISQIEQRKGIISKAVGTVDDYLQQALEKLKENADEQFNVLLKSTVKQQDALQQKSNEINKIVAELNNLTKVSQSMQELLQATRSQNGKLDNLVAAIQALAKAKVEGTSISSADLKPKIPLGTKIAIWTGSVLAALSVLALFIANWDSIYNIVIDVFAFQ
jgi:uncharacterized protein YsxB (DUF464 family)